MAQIAHDRDVQVASLGALANEVTALYGLRQSRLFDSKATKAAKMAKPLTCYQRSPCTDDGNPQNIKAALDEFYSLRNQAMSGRVTRALEGGLPSGYTGDWTMYADAPSLWPLEGRVTSSFGERQDPINGEGVSFHAGDRYCRRIRLAGPRRRRRRREQSRLRHWLRPRDHHQSRTRRLHRLWPPLSHDGCRRRSRLPAARSSATLDSRVAPPVLIFTTKCVSTWCPSTPTSTSAPATRRSPTTGFYRHAQRRPPAPRNRLETCTCSFPPPGRL